MKEEMIELYDRFSFDNCFRELLKEGLDYEDAIEFIQFNCKLSALVIQERIENKYYLNITVENIMSDDLCEFRQEIFNKIFQNKN